MEHWNVNPGWSVGLGFALAFWLDIRVYLRKLCLSFGNPFFFILGFASCGIRVGMSSITGLSAFGGFRKGSGPPGMAS